MTVIMSVSLSKYPAANSTPARVHFLLEGTKTIEFGYAES